MRRGSDRPKGHGRHRSHSARQLGVLLATALTLASCSHASFHRELPADKVQQADQRPPWRTPDKPTTLTPSQLRAQLQTLVDAMLKAENPAVANAVKHRRNTFAESKSLANLLQFYSPASRNQIEKDLQVALAKSGNNNLLSTVRTITLDGIPIPGTGGCIITKADLSQHTAAKTPGTAVHALMSFTSSPSIYFSKRNDLYREASDTRLFIIAMYSRLPITREVLKEVCQQ
jgi:hypothetical protein